jgi:hypothetical protein
MPLHRAPSRFQTSGCTEDLTVLAAARNYFLRFCVRSLSSELNDFSQASHSTCQYDDIH